MKEKTGPGRAKVYDPKEKRRESPAEVPFAGCSAARHRHCIPSRRSTAPRRRLWAAERPDLRKDTVLKDVVLKNGEKGPPPPCMDKTHRTTAAEVGQYWFDDIEDNDLDLAKKRAQNGIKRLLPVESASCSRSRICRRSIGCCRRGRAEDSFCVEIEDLCLV